MEQVQREAHGEVERLWCLASKKFVDDLRDGWVQELVRCRLRHQTRRA